MYTGLHWRRPLHCTPLAQMPAYGYAQGYGDPDLQWTLSAVNTSADCVEQTNKLGLNLSQQTTHSTYDSCLSVNSIVWMQATYSWDNCISWNLSASLSFHLPRTEFLNCSSLVFIVMHAELLKQYYFSLLTTNAIYLFTITPLILFIKDTALKLYS